MTTPIEHCQAIRYAIQDVLQSKEEIKCYENVQDLIAYDGTSDEDMRVVSDNWNLLVNRQEKLVKDLINLMKTKV